MIYSNIQVFSLFPGVYIIYHILNTGLTPNSNATSRTGVVISEKEHIFPDIENSLAWGRICWISFNALFAALYEALLLDPAANVNLVLSEKLPFQLASLACFS